MTIQEEYSPATTHTLRLPALIIHVEQHHVWLEVEQVAYVDDATELLAQFHQLEEAAALAWVRIDEWADLMS